MIHLIVLYLLKENIYLPLNTKFFISSPEKDTRPRTEYIQSCKNASLLQIKAQRRFCMKTKGQMA